MLSASFPHRVSQESRELLVVLETVDPPAQSAPLVLPAPLESPAERWVNTSLCSSLEACRHPMPRFLLPQASSVLSTCLER